MQTQSLVPTIIGSKTSLITCPAADQFGVLTGHAWPPSFLTKRTKKSTERTSRRIMSYQVIKGAVRTYKLLSDGRRQIGAFHLSGDVFGLESGMTHRLAAEAIIDTTVRSWQAPQPRTGGGNRC